MPDDRGGEGSQSYTDYQKSLEKDIHDRVHSSTRNNVLIHYKGLRGPGLVFAVLLIVVGVLLFLDNIGLVQFHEIWRYWPVGLILVGAAKLVDCCGIGPRVWAGMLIAAGTCFLLGNLGVWHVGLEVIWPLAIIGVGIMMLTNALERRGPGSDRVPARAFVTSSSGDPASGDVLREWVTFGGLKRKLDTQNFQGGDMVAVFGGIEVDLRRAAIAPGTKQVVIDANATFGGIELRVPETWRVITRGMGIFGGYEDKTIPPKTAEGVEAPRLLVKGYALFGGISIEN